MDREWISIMRRALVIALLLGGLSIFGLGRAGMTRATTGPSLDLPTTTFTVPRQIEQLYRGQYLLQQPVAAVRITYAAMAIDINTQGTLYGFSQFDGYDEHGARTTWTAALYNFHLVAHGVMVIDLLGPAGTPLLGSLSLRRAKNGALSGQIQFGTSGKKYSIAWRKTTGRAFFPLSS